jgi:hypothetical protein
MYIKLTNEIYIFTKHNHALKPFIHIRHHTRIVLKIRVTELLIQERICTEHINYILPLAQIFFLKYEEMVNSEKPNWVSVSLLMTFDLTQNTWTNSRCFLSVGETSTCSDLSSIFFNGKQINNKNAPAAIHLVNSF